MICMSFQECDWLDVILRQEKCAEPSIPNLLGIPAEGRFCILKSKEEVLKYSEKQVRSDHVYFFLFIYSFNILEFNSPEM